MRDSIAFVVIFHNAEDYVARVLGNVIKSAERGDAIIVIADGCTDSTGKKCKESLLNSKVSYRFKETDDLHEIGSLNVAFEMVEDQSHILHIQGDMVIDYKSMPILRNTIKCNPGLGLLSLRMGGCFELNGSNMELHLDEMNFGHNFIGPIIRKYQIRVRECCVAGRGPLIINREILKINNGKIDENLRPHSIDDVDLSLISLELGLKNYVMNLPYRSDVTWGATRSSSRSFKEPVNVSAERNLKYVREKHVQLLAEIGVEHSHQEQPLGMFLTTPYFFLGVLINRLLLRNSGRLRYRIQRKLAFLASRYFV